MLVSKLETCVSLSFSDKQLGNECAAACISVYQKCIGKCALSQSCTFECNAALNQCQNSCPCFENCPGGQFSKRSTVRYEKVRP